MLSFILATACAALSGGTSVEESIQQLRASIALESQDKTARIRELINKAEEASRAGRGAEAERCLAEAWALRAEVLNDQGKRGDAETAYNEARRHGWTGAPPWQGRATPTPTPTPTPKTGPQEKPQEKPPVPQPVRKPPKRRGGVVDTWPSYEMNPLKTSHNGAWNSLLGIPPMEEAIGIPEESWDARLWIEIQASDWENDDGGGPSRYHTDLHEESFEFNYGVTDTLLLGARLTMGELMEVDDEPIRLFNDNTQIVPTGDRAFMFSELVLRGKYVFSSSFASFGLMTEIKIPLAGEDDMLTAGSIDFALVGLITKRFGERLAVHINLGPVLPIGSAEVFTDGDANVFFLFGLGFNYKLSEKIGLLLQVEGNTSPWTDVGIDELTTRVTAGGRYKLGESIWLQGGFGMGINETSGGILMSGSIDLTF